MKKTLYFVGNDESEQKNSWLAVASDKDAALSKMSELSDLGATKVVAKEIDMRPRRRRRSKKS